MSKAYMHPEINRIDDLETDIITTSMGDNDTSVPTDWEEIPDDF